MIEDIQYKMKMLQHVEKENSGYINEQLAISDLRKGIELELIDLGHSENVGKALNILLKKLNELGDLKLYPYQYKMINLLSEFNTEKSSQELSELATDPDDFSSDIPSLKKRIKYCKNPLERKSLERQLNVSYKEMKKRR